MMLISVMVFRLETTLKIKTDDAIIWKILKCKIASILPTN